MKADASGTASEWTRHQAGWERRAAKNGPSCSGCVHFDNWPQKPDGTYSRTGVACKRMALATLANAVCRHHARRDYPVVPIFPMTTLEPDMTPPILSELDDLPTVGDLIARTDPPPIGAWERPTFKIIPAAGPNQAVTNVSGVEPYDRARVVSECRIYMGQSAEAMLEAGRRLIEIKANEPHGEFERIVEQDLNLPPRTAQVMMKAAAKFMGPALAGQKAQALTLLGKTKLFELMVEDDGDLAELADGGTLAGLKLDEIERMTSRELKAALRKARTDTDQKLADLMATLDAKDKRIARKDERINELEDTLERRGTQAPDAAADEYAHDLHNETLKIEASIGASLLSRSLAVLNSHAGVRQEHGRLLVAQALGRIMSACRVVADDLDIIPAEAPAPAFIAGAKGELADCWDAVNAAHQLSQAGAEG